MKKIIVYILLILCVNTFFAQVDEKSYSAGLSARIDSAVFLQYKEVEPFFTEAYLLYPTIPRGMLEAVSFTYTRFTHLQPSDKSSEESDMPCAYGLMGLTLDGRGFFRDNLRYVAGLSGFSVEGILKSPRDNVVAYAAAYAALQEELGVHSIRFEEQIPILTALSELPLSQDSILSFALNSSLYAIARIVDNDLFRRHTGATVSKPDYFCCFGRMLPLLQAGEVLFPVREEREASAADTDHAGALWNPAGLCNFTVGRGGHSISAVAIHYTQGTYASSIAWFRNCTYNGVGARASAHYVIRSFDGQITQMVREADKAWHVGNCNPYTIGIEHEAYGDIASYFTPEMYHSSARLVRDICDRNGISPHRMFYRDTLDDGTALNCGTHSLGGEEACVKIRGHQHFPNQSHTDPGPYWNWNYYYKLVNDDTPIIRLTASSGTLTDSGGTDGDYGNDERRLWLIQVDDAQRITLSFNEFQLENNYDFLWIYDGSTVYSPLIGRWNTTSPGIVTSFGNSLLVEFRSDCATTAAGWLAAWQAEMTEEDLSPTTDILWDENQWITGDFQLRFEDTDAGGIPYRFYQIVGRNAGNVWTSNANNGYCYDDFEVENLQNWSVQHGQWGIEAGRLCQRDIGFAEIQTSFSYSGSAAYLYEFDMEILSCAGEGGMAGIQIFITGNSAQTNAYRVVLFSNERQIRIYRMLQGSMVLLHTIEGVATETGSLYKYQIIYDAPVGKFLVFRNGDWLGEWRDSTTLTAVPSLSKMSLFTSGTTASFDNLRVYRSRGTAVDVAVGNASHCDLTWQARNGIPTAKVRALVLNDRLNFSPVAEKNLRVDYTKPELRRPTCVEVYVRGVWVSSESLFSLRWDAITDSHSGIVGYEYGYVRDIMLEKIRWIGTSQRPCVSFSMRPGSEPFYVAVRAVNGAGLFSDPIFSREQVVTNVMCQKQALNGATSPNSLYLWPNPTSENVWLRLTHTSIMIRIYDMEGKVVHEERIGAGKEKQIQLDVSFLKAGVYFVQSVGLDGTVLHGTFMKNQ